MIINKRGASLLLFFTLLSISAFSQSGTLSPYSMYGLGSLTDQSNGAGRGMNGVGQAFRESNQINKLNPASYSSIDSLTFIFDIGMSLQRTLFKEGTTTKGANTADFEYFIAGFRAMKHLGIGFGIVPYSDMGVNFSIKNEDSFAAYQQYPYDSRYKKITQTASYTSSGGLHEAFLGAGWEPFKGLSVGANVSFFWGSLGRTVYNSFSDGTIKSTYRIYSQKVHSYKLSFAAQYTQQLNNKDNMTVGVTVTPGHNLGGDAYLNSISTSSVSGESDTIKCVANGGYTLPTEIAAGVAFKHLNKWRIGLDYTYQNWGSISSKNYLKPDGSIVATTGSYNNRHKINVGGEWCNNPQSRSFFGRIRYRAGVSYSTPYLKINTLDGMKDGPREIAASMGLGIPIINNYNNRSILNIGFQWVNESGSIIRENTFRINIGLTFNERWFAKWKFD